MKIKYNAPVTLSYALLCSLVMLVTFYFWPSFTERFFQAPGREGFSALNPVNLFTLVSHIIGHLSWAQLAGNFSIILIAGPMLENIYGSRFLFTMIGVTAITAGTLNALFFQVPLLGSSGVVFMMILLASFTNFSKKEIPLTFILVLALYLGNHIAISFELGSLSQFAHIAGGFCGSLFGFFAAKKRQRNIKVR
jgi:membrane associated rhomboid family serine protease